ncbi:transglutaminase-like cysteine peptidase [Ferrimonas senticii]|uniref:transglutaminase-like cysteine peptidase n=1 Tax=Ferrimonas senticii TaxID=394566 RepID=UPI00041B7748|nr:transglutaminase-like cysteine peptidase [Ferrimonas senticii]
MNRRIVALWLAYCSGTGLLVGALAQLSPQSWLSQPEWQPAQQERLLQYYGEAAAIRYRHWQQLVRDQQQQPTRQQLQAVNQHLNQYQFHDDSLLWQQSNYWATPLEFIGRGGGDCEDFALAKLVTLQQLGIPAEQLRLVYVKAETLNQHHMVLAWYASPSAEPLLLDNLNGQLLPASQRPDLTPIFSFSGQQLWRGSGSQRLQDTPPLNLWQQFQQRRQLGQMRPLPSGLGATP